MLLFNGARESPLCKLHFASLFSILINFWWLDESKCIVIHPPAQDLKPLIPFVWGGSLVYPTYVRNVPILVPFHLTEVTRSHCITFRYWRTNLVILSSWMMKPLNIALDTSDEHFTRPVAYYKRWKFHKTSCLLQEVFECFQMNYMDSWKWYMNLAHTSIVLFVNISSKGI